MVTDVELYFWIASAVVGLISFGALWHVAKKDGENYLEMENCKC